VRDEDAEAERRERAHDELLHHLAQRRRLVDAVDQQHRRAHLNRLLEHAQQPAVGVLGVLVAQVGEHEVRPRQPRAHPRQLLHGYDHRQEPAVRLQERGRHLPHALLD